MNNFAETSVDKQLGKDLILKKKKLRESILKINKIKNERYQSSFIKKATQVKITNIEQAIEQKKQFNFKISNKNRMTKLGFINDIKIFYRELETKRYIQS